MFRENLGCQLRDLDTVYVDLGSGDQHCRSLAPSVVLQRHIYFRGRPVPIKLFAEKLEKGLLLLTFLRVFPVR